MMVIISTLFVLIGLTTPVASIASSQSHLDASQWSCKSLISPQAPSNLEPTLEIVDHIKYLQESKHLMRKYASIFKGDLAFELYFDFFVEVVHSTLFKSGIDPFKLPKMWRIPSDAEFSRQRINYLVEQGWIEFTLDKSGLPVNAIATEKLLEAFGSLAKSLKVESDIFTTLIRTQKEIWDSVFMDDGKGFNPYSYSVLHGVFSQLGLAPMETIERATIVKTFKIKERRVDGFFTKLIKEGRTYGAHISVNKFFDVDHQTRYGHKYRHGSRYQLSQEGLDLWSQFFDRL